MPTVALIDYGSGNLASAEQSLVAACRQTNDRLRVVVTDKPEEIRAAERIVLPGVGAFAACMRLLSERDGLIEALDEAAHSNAKPFLGVCVGMQLLATRGLEFGETRGLDWIAGEVRRITPAGHQFKVPHMGWNALVDVAGHPLFENLPGGAHMYFTHSFAFFPDDETDIAACVDHGGRVVAAVARGNVAGVQFHPEKSQAAGLKLLANFLEWRP
jgi:glutamine amidotransferase